ncbi:diguanylate cyclase [Pseudorhodoferax sp.]|uniref:GGDEF domain-containing protein n=1 Tax=Pseudorhodoferax sp. TaxID=1993553 RepID=UPI0039E27EA1
MDSQRDSLQQADHPGAAAAASASLGDQLAGGLVVAAIVTAACLFGVWTRLTGQLAVFWPANALLLGIMLRYPRLDTTAGWVGAAAGYLLAGYLAGDALPISVLLTLCNFASVVSCYLLMARPGSEARRLQGVGSVLQMLLVVMLAAGAAAAAGAVVGPIAFGRPALQSACAWFVSEMFNYIAILPAMLSIPAAVPRRVPRQWRANLPHWRRLGPLLALLASLGCALAVGGPGALAFPVPALLWCGMRYGVFTTSVLTLLTTAWTLVALSRGHLNMAVAIDTPQMLMSVRVGITMIALSPIAVASAVAANTALLARLRHMAEHDPLTGMMNRRAFAEQAGRALAAAREAGQPAGLLILDIDRFKSVNDNYGHSAGDMVIVHVAHALRSRLPPGPPLLGRLGGEEFAVLLPGCDAQQAMRIAESMRQACANRPVAIGDGRRLTVTVSIGVDTASPAPAQLDQMLQAADRALYEAKHAGRNRVVA